MAKDIADLSGPNQAPAETPTSTSAGMAEQAEDVTTRHRWPNPGPGPNLDPNFKGGLQASADRLALTWLRPLIRTGWIRTAGSSSPTDADAVPMSAELLHGRRTFPGTSLFPASCT